MLTVFVGCLRLPYRMLTVEKGPGLHLPVHLLDAMQAIPDQLDRGNATLANICGRFEQ